MSLAARQRETVARLLAGRAGEGEAVHAANIRATLTQTLATTSPVTEALVGPDYFRGLAVAFLAAHPPTRPVLAQYGAELPAFLDSHAAAEALPYLPDLARLEWARQTAYFAADAAPVGAGEVAGLAEADRFALRLARHPSVTVLRSTRPVFAIWAAHQPGGPPLEAVDPDGPGECGAVYRKGSAVSHLPLDRAAEALLREFDGDTALGDVLDSLRGRMAEADLGAALALLLSAEVLTS